MKSLRLPKKLMGKSLSKDGALSIQIQASMQIWISSMTLEHYPGMTEKQLEHLEAEARERWSLQAVLIIHRYGELLPGDRIVLVVTASEHREASLESCQFLIDWLKTKAPFWKLEDRESGAEWVESREEDSVAADRWVRVTES